MVLDDANFSSNVKVNSSDVWFIRFYAPVCFRLSVLCSGVYIVKEWKTTGKKRQPCLRERLMLETYFYIGVIYMKLDATKELETASQFRIRGYPTVLLFYKVHNCVVLRFRRQYLCTMEAVKLLRWRKKPEERWTCVFVLV